MSWICDRCGSSIRQDAPVCPACAPGALAHRIDAPGLNADVLVLRPETRTSPKRRSYNDPHFDEFWIWFPLKLDKKKAHLAWCAIAPDDALAQRIIAAAKQYARYVSINQTEAKHTKYPQGWLNGERWNDVLPLPRAAGEVDFEEEQRKRRAEEDARIAEMDDDDEAMS